MGVIGLFKFVAIVLIGLGIFIGLKYNDEINEFISSDVVEEIYEGAESVVDKIDN